jgi:hypothetical protein
VYTQIARGYVQAVSPVGERALAAVRCDRHLEVYHSRWAAGDERLARVLDSPVDPLDALVVADWGYRGRYTASGFPPQVDTLDIEAVYLVSVCGVRVYRPVWLGLSWPDGRSAGGVLVRVDTLGEYHRLRAAVQFLKGVFHEASWLGWVDRPTARDLFALAVRTYCRPERIHTPGTPL